MKIEIKHKLTGEVLFSAETDSIKLAVLSAIKAKANLRYADLRSADLSSANLRYADLSYADLSSANLRSADLSYANLRYADLRSADLSHANLSYANLSSADLSYADLSYADLRSADLRYANLRSADLSYANLSYANGLSTQCGYIKENFEKTKNGIIVYKTFGENNQPNKNWDIKPKSILKEVVNPCRTVDCACGINVATLKWVKLNTSGDIWQGLIKWEWMVGVVVPYYTDGKIRTEKLQLIKKIKR
jgi:uncharacterized protein YjbI with pentapeptide repeats